MQLPDSKEHQEPAEAGETLEDSPASPPVELILDQWHKVTEAWQHLDAQNWKKTLLLCQGQGGSRGQKGEGGRTTIKIFLSPTFGNLIKFDPSYCFGWFWKPAVGETEWASGGVTVLCAFSIMSLSVTAQTFWSGRRGDPALRTNL